MPLPADKILPLKYYPRVKSRYKPIEGTLTSKMVAHRLSIHEATVRKYVKQGKLIGAIVGNHMLITIESLNDYLAERFGGTKKCVQSSSSEHITNPFQKGNCHE